MKWKKGDVFTVPIDEDHVGIGQIAEALKDQLYVVIFNGKHPRDDLPSIPSAVEQPHLLASMTLDAKLYHGHWEVIGNTTENLTAEDLPWFKVRINDVMHVESCDKKTLRPATEEEERTLPIRSTYSPAVLEKALQAEYGVIEAKPAYAELRCSPRPAAE